MKALLNPIRIIILFMCFLLAIIFPEEVASGAKSGVDLCIKVVIPSIFPLLLLSLFLCNQCDPNSLKMLNPICKFVHCPTNNKSILLLAILGGYPVGAQAIAEAYRQHQLSRNNAKRMLGFCNNAGPAFIFGLLSTLFPNKYAPVLLWLIHITSALIVGHLLPITKEDTLQIITHKKQKAPLMHCAIITMGIICGWITLFRTILSILQPLVEKYFPNSVQVLIFGAIELTNGCVLLPQISSEFDRFVIASALLSIGGLCVAFQVKTITYELGFGNYILGKIMQTSISIIIASSIGSLLYQTSIRFVPVIVSLFVLIGIYFITKNQKKIVAFLRIA